MIIIATFLILTMLGIYLILADVFEVSKLKTSKTILNISKKEKKKSAKSLEVLLLDMATKISKYISLDDYKKGRLEMTLRSAQIKISPETYVADVYIKTGIVFIISVISFFITPFLSILFIIYGCIVYKREYNKAEEILKKRKNKIEYELPKFAMNIEQELKSSRDVLKILEIYHKHNYKTNLGEELEITIADMRSGSYEEALRRFETRIGSSSLSEIIRGLMGVLHGNDETLYFRMLAHDLKELEYQRLRGIVLKRPQKIKKYSAMMLSCLMLVYGVVLGYEIVNGLSSMFK